MDSHNTRNIPSQVKAALAAAAVGAEADNGKQLTGLTPAATQHILEWAQAHNLQDKLQMEHCNNRKGKVNWKGTCTLTWTLSDQERQQRQQRYGPYIGPVPSQQQQTTLAPVGNAG